MTGSITRKKKSEVSLIHRQRRLPGSVEAWEMAQGLEDAGTSVRSLYGERKITIQRPGVERATNIQG